MCAHICKFVIYGIFLIVFWDIISSTQGYSGLWAQGSLFTELRALYIVVEIKLKSSIYKASYSVLLFWPDKFIMYMYSFKKCMSSLYILNGKGIRKDNHLIKNSLKQKIKIGDHFGEINTMFLKQMSTS